MLFIKKTPEPPKTTQAIPNALGCLLELNSKAPHFGCRTQKSQTGINQPTSNWLAFIAGRHFAGWRKRPQWSDPLQDCTGLLGKGGLWETQARDFPGMQTL